MAKPLLSSDEELLVIKAIRAAEKGHRGELRVHLETHAKDGPARARRLFKLLGLHRTAENTGVLLHVAHRDGRATVHADTGLASVPADAWAEAADAAERGLARGEAAAGIIEALDRLGALLREHVPGVDLEGNELPDRITTERDDPDSPHSTETVATEDVDDLIAIATQLREQEEDALHREDLLAIATELGLESHHVDRAEEELARRRAERARQEEEDRRFQRRLLYAGVGLALLVGLFGLVGQASLRKDLAEVEAHRAQLRNVLDRQEEVKRRYRGAQTGPDWVAEVSGAENRVGVERRRHDQVVSDYRARASSFPGALWVRIFGLPKKPPLSHEIEW
ncbi:MAG: TPM domain-containing protein [Acidobacteriota bacterium]